jgi:hypothetical protein
MQILADAKRAELKASGDAERRAARAAAATPAVKAAGKAFYSSMIVDSAYDGELCEDFSQWLTKETRA